MMMITPAGKEGHPMKEIIEEEEEETIGRMKENGQTKKKNLKITLKMWKIWISSSVKSKPQKN